ncbi:Zn(2)-Cys(6) zinc finger domain protein [Purpureocillium lavendulum]|uniref:Zn(2)-Cys(6) zinc finger domain protein n=1 Tax=Purpureocillium lavendulum TaxID=1247861 RepID=A0AB34FPR2_9HYPO|nr:Zn(2)-Cys(6) zinc finger domain protein [Purpureocillium lavendulum]
MPPQSPDRREKQPPYPPSASRYTPRKHKTRGSGGSSKEQLVSPNKKKQAKQPLHIRMNLTETQMDKITDAFTSKVTNSPVRARPRVDTTPTKHMPSSQPGSSNRQDMNCAFSSSGEEDVESRVASTTFSELMPRHQPDIFAARGDPNLATRRQVHVPSPIQVGARRIPGAVAFNPEQTMPVSPLTPPVVEHHGYPPARAEGAHASGFYPVRQQRVSAARRDTYTTDASEGNVNGPVIDMYNAWTTMHSTGESFEPPPRVQSLAQRPRRSKSTSEGLTSDYLRRPGTLNSPSPPPPALPRQDPGQVVVTARDETFEDQVFSPLALYFCGQDFPTVKKGEKTMIGQNGWLERTERCSPEKGTKTPQKKAGILQSIKKMARDMTAEFSNPSRRSQAQAKDAGPPPQIAISLNPREQSLLYCELEYHLTGAIHDFITGELERGHLVADNLKKIADYWFSQGRPKVVGFRYDLETQLELVSLHVNDFNFYGRRQSNPVEIAGLLHCMKVNARQIRVRTFCQPDSVIAKQLVDSQSLFNMINVSRARQIGLAEIAQFFKVIVEREKDYREKRSREVRKTRVAQPGQSFAGAGWQQYDRPGQHQQQQQKPQSKQSHGEQDHMGGDRTSYGAREEQGYDTEDEELLPYAR